MVLDSSASGGNVVGANRDLFSPPRGLRGPWNGAGVVDRSGSRGGDATRQSGPYDSRTIVHDGADGVGGGSDTAVLHRGGGSAWRSALADAGGSHTNESVVAGAATRLAEAWSLLESSEAARRRLSEEVKSWAEKAAGLEEALAAAEATAETRAREARLLAASLQDAREALAFEEAARREAEGRADALR